MAKRQEQQQSQKSYEIRTPVQSFTGERFGVKIDKGVGYTHSEAVARECLRVGYSVIDADTKKPLSIATQEE